MSERPNERAANADFEFAALTEAVNYRAALVADFSAYLRGQVIEVGAGAGQITDLLLQRPEIRRLVVIEPGPNHCARLRARLRKTRVIEGTIDDLKEVAAWNAILCVNVLEHIGADERELAIYHKLLTPEKGTLCLFVPARPEIYAPLDRDFGHFRRYTRVELKAKLERAGFKIARLHYFNSAGYFAWWWNFCVLKKRHFDMGAVRFFDRFVFPPVHAFESRLCHPPFGQSLMAVAHAA
jgi:SAM-dependent methyltransferase